MRNVFEFHGVSAFGNNVDVSLTGWTDTSAYVLFDGAQFGPSSQENLYLDQQNETFLCAANCYFTSSWHSGCIAGQSCSAIEIGADSRTKVTEQTSLIAQFNQGLFTSAQKYDVYFDNPGGNYCKCRVALGGGMVDVATPAGIDPAQPN